MMTIFIDVMIFLGSALMIRNICFYVRYIKRIHSKGEWKTENLTLFGPLVLLIFFLFGYVFVAVFGTPDLMMSAILFFGSVFVMVMVNMLSKVTAKVQENEHLEARLLAAEESSRAKTSFLSNMSHEIRTPMNAIIGIETLAQRDPDLSPHIREQFEKIDVSARHLLELINDILDMSRIESGKVELKEEPFVIRELLEQVNSIIAAQCGDKGLTYEFQEPQLVCRRFAGDAMKLRQVLINILGNSVKFTPAPGTVSFRVEQGERYGDLRALRFIMSDTGIGMDEEFIPKMFEPFTQEDSTSTNRYGGTGLGMSLCKRYVDMMDGEIQVRSEKGKGTTFTVIVTLKPLNDEDEGCEPQAARLTEISAETAFDAAAKDAKTAADAAGADAASTQQAAQETEAAAEPAESAPVSLEGLRVLIAEDIEMNAEILADLLELEGVESEWAKNGQEAVDMFMEHMEQEDGPYYDAILMDMRMPVMDGLEASRKIRAICNTESKTIPIIALTANAFEEDVKRSLQAGLNAHLSKPVDPNLLMETLSKLVNTPTPPSDSTASC